MSTRSRESNEVAVSVIIGTLLLILITVTAASALALMVSQMQKEEASRQAHLSAMKNEQLKVQYIHLANNKTPGYAGYWDTANITILNLNIDESRILSLSINGVYAGKIYVTGNPYNETQPYYDVSQNQWISIPATQKADLLFNFSTDLLQPQPGIATNQSIHILVLTSLYNVFERTFVPPTPVIKISTDTQDLGVTQKTILVLDGSGSSSAGGNIVNYTWSMFDNSTQTLLPQGYGTIFKSEMPSQGPFIVNLTVTDDSGLTQTSQNMTISANPAFAPPTHIVIKPNVSQDGDEVQFSPLWVISGVDAWVNDSSDNPVPNQVVTFTEQGNNITLSRWNGVTGPGTNPATSFALNTTTPFAGVITVSYGKLPPQNMQVL